MQDLIRDLPAVVFEYAIYPDGNEGFTEISEQCEGILGLKSRDLKSDPALLFSIIHKEDLSALRDGLSQRTVVTGTRLWRGRILAGKETKWVEARFTDATDGGVILRRGFLQDVIAEGNSFSAKAYHDDSLWEKVPVGIVIHHDGKIIFANSHAHKLIGAEKPDGLPGRNVLDFVHPDYIPDICQRINRVSEGDSVPMVEEKFIRADGTIIDVETMAYPFFYKGMPAVQVIFRDITEKKRTETEMRKNETLFSQLFQNVPMAVVMLDEAGKVFRLNKGFEQMFGYSKEELCGKNLNDFIVPEELRHEGIDLNNLISAHQAVSIESIRKHRSGKLVNVILCGVPVMLDNEAIGIYGVYVDISDRKKVEEELKIRNTELDNFVYKVSHDLRAPLSSILGLVNLSLVKGNTDNPLEYIEIIGKKIEGLDHFINDVLSHSKNLKMDVSNSRVDLRAIIDQTIKDLGYLEGAREMKQSIKIEGIDFYSDQWRVAEIFRNLVSNAIKYRQTDAGDSTISIKINVDHLCADISFADNGIGISENSLRRIFDMFYRATQQSDGSGIGLYIVKNAVERIGGQINVASKPGIGTRFHILLPNRINSGIKTQTLPTTQE